MFTNLNRFLLSFENLESIELIGMGIVDNLQDMAPIVNRPKLKRLSLPYNGIEAQFCVFFQQMLPLETLEEIDLSSNWFGTAGLAHLKTQFGRLQRLKVLNLGNSKLGLE